MISGWFWENGKLWGPSFKGGAPKND
jgi:hypothetical protein